MNSDAATTATAKERHDQLTAILSENYSGLLELEIKNSGLLIIGLGWLASSTTLQSLIRSNFNIALAATVATIALAVIYVVWVASVYRGSQQAHFELSRLAFLPDTYYRSRLISPLLVACLVGTQFVLYALIIVFAWTIYAT